MQRKVYSFNSELFKVTGVQKVLMDVHHAVMDEYDAKIVGTVPFEKVHKDLDIHEEEYVRFRNPFMFRNSIVILHERKFLAFFWILNHVLFQNIKLVYIHHSIFSNHRRMSIMPKTVVAISDESLKNLHDFFGVPKKNIHEIYNCVRDESQRPHNVYNSRVLKIAYVARVDENKRQLDIVRNLKGKLNDNVKISFIGNGPNLDALKQLVSNDIHFECLGYCSNVCSLLQKSDYVMLFSTQEGLPISLIEATMMGVPIICSNVGGNSEVVQQNENGFVLDKDDWTGLVNLLKYITKIPEKEYMKMCNKSRALYESNFTFEIFQRKYKKLVLPLFSLVEETHSFLTVSSCMPNSNRLKYSSSL